MSNLNAGALMEPNFSQDLEEECHWQPWLDVLNERYYDPVVGKFISEDRLRYGSGTLNFSEYIGNNPVNRNDPSGMTDVAEVDKDINSLVANAELLHKHIVEFKWREPWMRKDIGEQLEKIRNLYTNFDLTSDQLSQLRKSGDMLQDAERILIREDLMREGKLPTRDAYSNLSTTASSPPNLPQAPDPQHSDEYLQRMKSISPKQQSDLEKFNANSYLKNPHLFGWTPGQSESFEFSVPIDITAPAVDQAKSQKYLKEKMAELTKADDALTLLALDHPHLAGALDASVEIGVHALFVAAAIPLAIEVVTATAVAVLPATVVSVAGTGVKYIVVTLVIWGVVDGVPKVINSVEVWMREDASAEDVRNATKTGLEGALEAAPGAGFAAGKTAKAFLRVGPKIKSVLPRLDPRNYSLKFKESTDSIQLGANNFFKKINDSEIHYNPNVNRTAIIQELGETAQPFVKSIKALDPDALVGFRGSLARGFKGPHKNNLPFDPRDFDVDAFIVSDTLAAKFPASTGFPPGTDIPELRAIQNSLDSSLRSSTNFKGLRSERFTFRIFTRAEMDALLKKSDAQIYFVPGQ